MAKRTITKLVDDIDGSVATETVEFGLDGRTYSIDLNAKNAKKLRELYARYIAVATKVGKSARPKGSKDVRGKTRGQGPAIRAWAARKGISVAPRGRIRAEVVAEYERDQRTK
ncbi:MAG TPA: Lsr2 family protein [Candidatus Saccharimonadia bacterium]|jgi:hypothetical protein|nr:Lsr2 family protein [Candidatus Saccharimonadia bacterium]